MRTTPPTEAKMPILAPVESLLNFCVGVSGGGWVTLSATTDLPLWIISDVDQRRGKLERTS